MDKKLIRTNKVQCLTCNQILESRDIDSPGQTITCGHVNIQGAHRYLNRTGKPDVDYRELSRYWTRDDQQYALAQDIMKSSGPDMTVVALAKCWKVFDSLREFMSDRSPGPEDRSKRVPLDRRVIEYIHKLEEAACEQEAEEEERRRNE